MNTSYISLLKIVALLEGSSLLALLFIGLPLKYMAKMAIAVKIIAPIHGVLFLSFVVVILLCMLKRELSFGKTLIGILSSFIPFGSFIFKAKCLHDD